MSYEEIAGQFLSELQPSGDIFSAGPIVHQEPNWFDRIKEPFVTVGEKIFEAGETFVTRTTEQLPQMLFDYGLEKLGGVEKRTVETGPGTSVTYKQPAEPGGAPAQPYYQIFMPQQPAQQQQPSGLSTEIIVVIVIAIILLFGR